jgi:OOP family OmpA-OmpF porin
MKTRLFQLLFCCASALLLSQCSIVGPMLQPSKVIYALPTQSVASPLEQALTDACDPIIFSRDHFMLGKNQRAVLAKQAVKWQEDKQHLLVVGFAQRGFPASYARSLSQRRAESVRQVLIEEGIDAAAIHSTGYGHDQPTLSSRDEVRVFLAK